MKLLPLIFAFIACVPVFSQDQPAIRFKAFRTATGVRVNGTLHEDTLVGTASSIQSNEALHVAQLKGNVEIIINGIKLRADEVDLHWDSGAIDPRGSVRLTSTQQ